MLSSRANLLGSLCSQIRIVNGRAEVFLIAESGGKFDTNGKTYSLSSAPRAYDEMNIVS